jgi:hypothetical protein
LAKSFTFATKTFAMPSCLTMEAPYNRIHLHLSD